MSMNRREFLFAAGGVVATSGLELPSVPSSRFKAIAFDAFPIFDPRPVAKLTLSLLPGSGAALVDIWRTKLFEYQWLRALAGQYADFMAAAEASLRFAAAQAGVRVPEETVEKLLGEYRQLKVWPDAPAAVAKLRRAGLRLVFLSNMTRPMLEDGLKAAGMTDAFDHILSTDAIRSFKPDPAAYKMAIDALKVRREDVLFVAFAGWDAAGAKWFGYPTFWMNRAGSRMEELGVTPDGVGQDMEALTEFVFRS